MQSKINSLSTVFGTPGSMKIWEIVNRTLARFSFRQSLNHLKPNRQSQFACLQNRRFTSLLVLQTESVLNDEGKYLPRNTGGEVFRFNQQSRRLSDVFRKRRVLTTWDRRRKPRRNSSYLSPRILSHRANAILTMGWSAYVSKSYGSCASSDEIVSRGDLSGQYCRVLSLRSATHRSRQQCTCASIERTGSLEAKKCNFLTETSVY